MNKLLLVALVIAGLSGCGANKAISRGEINTTWSDASDAKTLRFRGLGVPPASTSSVTQRMGLSRQAAQSDARTLAVAYLKGIRINGDIEVGQLALKNSHIHGLVDRVVAGLVEERVEWLADGGAMVVMSIDRKLVDKMIADTQAYDAPATATAPVAAQ